MRNHKVLIIDDESFVLSSIQRLLVDNGYTVEATVDGDVGVEKIRANPFQYAVVVLDYKLPNKNGAVIAAEILSINPEIKIAMHSGYGTIENVRNTFKAGAVDFIEKGNDPTVLLNAVDSIYRKFEEGRTVSPYWAVTSNEKLLSHLGIVGRAAEMAEVGKKIYKFGATDSPVLIRGENGTGKELVAKAIFKNSARKNHTYVEQNFAAFNEGTLESELFGHVKGSFTGAVRDKQGVFERADKGTLFLDEIGDASPAMQAKLLRVIQEGTFLPVGGEKTKKVDVRIIAATNRNLHEMVKSGKFREDLYYRLNVLSIELPPLRKRVEDIEPLVSFFCHKMAEKTGQKKRFLMRTVRQMEKYPWPGNVRQLENTVEAIWALCPDEKVDTHHLESKFFEKTEQDNPDYRALSWETFETWIEEKKREYIKRVVLNSRSKSEAAMKMGISPSTLHTIMKNLGLYRETENSDAAVSG